MGVNRAGSTYFEGMIDEAAVVFSARRLGNHRTEPGRAGTCQPLSVAGAQVASVSQTFDLPEELGDHAWLALAHGRRLAPHTGPFM